MPNSMNFPSIKSRINNNKTIISLYEQRDEREYIQEIFIFFFPVQIFPLLF